MKIKTFFFNIYIYVLQLRNSWLLSMNLFKKAGLSVMSSIYPLTACL